MLCVYALVKVIIYAHNALTRMCTEYAIRFFQGIVRRWLIAALTGPCIIT